MKYVIEIGTTRYKIFKNIDKMFEEINNLEAEGYTEVDWYEEE